MSSEGWQQKIHRKLGESVFRTALKDFTQGKIKRFSVGGLVALIIAVLTLAVPVFFICFAIYYIALDYDNFEHLAPGAFLLVLGYFLLPKRLKVKEKTLSAKELPKFFELIDEISAELNVKASKKLIVTSEVSAFVFDAGYGGDTHLGIGAPLWCCLDPQERVAMLAMN